MYLIKTPNFIKTQFPQLTWEHSAGKKHIYLTFDDGPHPEITIRTLDILKSYDASATYFCVGRNIKKYPDIFDQIRIQNHGIGSHSYHHLSGWATDNKVYFQDVVHAAHLADSLLFRPPFGRIKPSQIKMLTDRYQIIMWSVLSGDFDQAVSPEKCLDNVIRHASDGSIVVFHDTEKAAERMLYTLPRILEYYSKKGFQFKALPHSRIKASQRLRPILT